MKDFQHWRPSILVHSNGRFEVNEAGIYGGSLHMTERQCAVYVPYITKYASGTLLDVGCGKVPYFELCKPLVTSHFCIDHPQHSAESRFIDTTIDLNQNWQLDMLFDTILCTDVLAHVKNPFVLFESLGHHLKPNGHLVLTTPFHYWQSHPPQEYFHPTAEALKHLCELNNLEIIALDSYGGYADIQLDMWNKRWNSGWKYRLFKVFKKIFINTAKYRSWNANNTYNWALGYILVARQKA